MSNIRKENFNRIFCYCCELYTNWCKKRTKTERHGALGFCFYSNLTMSTARGWEEDMSYYKNDKNLIAEANESLSPQEQPIN